MSQWIPRACRHSVGSIRRDCFFGIARSQAVATFAPLDRSLALAAGSWTIAWRASVALRSNSSQMNLWTRKRGSLSIPSALGTSRFLGAFLS